MSKCRKFISSGSRIHQGLEMDLENKMIRIPSRKFTYNDAFFDGSGRGPVEHSSRVVSKKIYYLSIEFNMGLSVNFGSELIAKDTEFLFPKQFLLYFFLPKL